ncbi:MAG: DNA methyltransferase [Anaerohalosphaeraceae bacterium]
MRKSKIRPSIVAHVKNPSQPEATTVWSFPVRGSWATHSSRYRGNFAPQVARNIIQMYSQPGQTVLDPMAGGGTTLIECRLLGRRYIGCDINPAAVALCEQAVDFPLDGPDAGGQIVCADVRDLSFLADASVDLILTHPPYLNLIRYSSGRISGDLSNISSVDKFCRAMREAAAELYRVLKGGRFCAILIGDTRRGRHFVPLAFRVMEQFLEVGFVLKEDIIKVQHNCTCTGRWIAAARRNRFYLIMHEHLFVFRKPAPREDLSRLKDSRRPAKC